MDQKSWQDPHFNSPTAADGLGKLRVEHKKNSLHFVSVGLVIVRICRSVTSAVLRESYSLQFVDPNSLIQGSFPKKLIGPTGTRTDNAWGA